MKLTTYIAVFAAAFAATSCTPFGSYTGGSNSAIPKAIPVDDGAVLPGILRGFDDVDQILRKAAAVGSELPRLGRVLRN